MMFTGKTKSGFTYCIPEKRIQNMELLDALTELETNGAALPKVVNLLLGAAVDALHLLVWGKTKDGQKGRSRPEPVVNRLLGVPGQRQATGFSCAAEYEAARARILGAG